MVQAFTLVLMLLSPRPIEHEFAYVSPIVVERVYVAGSFNSWSPTASPMTSTNGKNWTVKLLLAPGRYTYKFVINGSQWLVDPSNNRVEDDGNGNTNSLFYLFPPEYATPCSRGDGKITESVVGHETNALSLNFDQGKVQLKISVRPNDVDSVSVVSGKSKVKLDKVSSDEVAEIWSGYVPWDRKSNLNYQFKITDGPKSWFFGPDGLASKPTKAFSIDQESFRPFEVPLWVEQSVIYQIFPDRFASAMVHEGVQPWDTDPKWNTRLGGDIAGVKSKIGYLKQLGIKAVYFNPVFKSPSIHRYETTDYKQIDPLFGTNDEFVDLVKSLKKKGIGTVIDLAVNHTAIDFPAFADIRTNGEKSKYKDWYFIHSYPVKVQGNPNYDAWFGFPSMPKLNAKNPEVRAYLLDAISYWHRVAPIAGWRLDVPNEVDSSFWKAFRPSVKGYNPNAWIVGEIWGNGTPWLQGDQFDSVMNYPFRDAVVKFIAEGSIRPSEFMQKMSVIDALYSPQVSRNLMNLLSSHDTPRFMTLCKNDPKLAKLGATLLLTWLGAPSIYYGDELGMDGDRDPQNRKGMKWSLDTSDNSLLLHYKKLIALRNSSSALQKGRVLPILMDDKNGILSFGRIDGNDFVVVILNRSDKDQIVKLKLPRTDILQYNTVVSGSSMASAVMSNDNTLELKINACDSLVLRNLKKVGVN